MQTAGHFTAETSARQPPLSVALIAALLLAPSLLCAQSESPATTSPGPASQTVASTPGTMPPAGSSTLDQVRQTGKLKLGFFAAARPLSYLNPEGNADGFTVALCRGIAAIVKAEIGRPDLAVHFVPVKSDPIAAIKEGRIDLMCAPMQPTLSRRADVSFSIPVFAGGTGLLIRKDANKEFRALAEGRSPSGDQSLWRGQPQLQILKERAFVVVSGTSSERTAKARKQELAVKSAITTVPDLKTGLEQVLEGKADAFLAERSVLLDLAHHDPSGNQVTVVNRVIDHSLLALAMRRGDEDFRLLVDKTLSRLYRTGRIDGIYEQHLGKPDKATREWFRQFAEPE